VIDVPEAFVREVVGREGAEGERWLASLPGLADEFLERWCSTPTGPVMHGRVGIVVPVRRDDGSSAVLKISFPHPGNAHEPTAFAAWSGRGAVMLLARDDARFAMLLEQVEQTTLVECHDGDEAAAVCGRLTRRLAVPAPPDLPRLGEGTEGQERHLRDAFERLVAYVPRRVVEAAIGTLRELGRDQPDTLVHGDLHYKNVVRASREPWLAIDPKGFAGDPANDALSVVIGGYQRGLAMDDLCAQLPRRLAIFAEAAELDRERVVRWTQVRALLHVCSKSRTPGRADAARLAGQVATVLS
jgi:streptomycin 6-kinase